MDVNISSKKMLQRISSLGAPHRSQYVTGREEIIWTVQDQDNNFEFIEACGCLAATNWTISSLASEEFIAFIKYLELFYNLDISKSSDFKRIMQGR